MPLIHAAWKAMLDIVGGDESILEALLKKARSSTTNPCGLSEIERMAVLVYSNTMAGWYSRINDELWRVPSSSVAEFEAVLNSALDKLPAFNGFTYRGYEAPDIALYLMNFYPTKMTVFRGFTSSAKSQYEAFHANTMLIIYSRNGKELGDYASDPSEGEVLYRSGCRFRVTKVEHSGVSPIIWLDEVT